MSIVLGIDPGSRIAGFGVVEVTAQGERHIDHGVIRLNETLPIWERLHEMHQAMEQLISSYRPNELAVEEIFLGKNPHSAFVLGHIRGVCLERGVAHGMGVFQYAARKIKKSITGNGSAKKDQVQFMVGQLLGLENLSLPMDATDALAVAITHARHATQKTLLAEIGREL